MIFVHCIDPSPPCRLRDDFHAVLLTRYDYNKVFSGDDSRLGRMSEWVKQKVESVRFEQVLLSAAAPSSSLSVPVYLSLSLLSISL